MTSRASAAPGVTRPLIVMMLSATALAADANPCAPAAHVTGDRDAVVRVSAELVRLGVAVEARQAGCPAPIEAAVELATGSALSVAISDAAHRSEGRTVDNATVAAEWIDSWLHDSLDPWRELPGETHRAVALPVAATTAAPGEAEIRASAPLDTRPSLFDRLQFSAGYEQSYTTDGSSWRGLSIAACERFGAACIGVRGRYASQSIESAATAADRRDMSLLAIATTTLHAGSMLISPELGVGLGVMTTARVDGCGAPPQCDPTGSDCPPTTPVDGCLDADGSGGSGGVAYVGDHFSSTTLTPRAEVAIRIAVPLASRVFLDGLAGATAMPFGHGDDYQADRVPPGLSPQQVALPGEPAFSLQVGIGLRVESP